MQNSQLVSLYLHFQLRWSGISFLIIRSLHLPNGQGTSKKGHVFRWSCGGDGRVRRRLGSRGGAGRRPYGYLLELHLFLAAVGFAATVNLQHHDLPLAADVFEDLRRQQSGRQTRVSCASVPDACGRVASCAPCL